MCHVFSFVVGSFEKCLSHRTRYHFSWHYPSHFITSVWLPLSAISISLWSERWTETLPRTIAINFNSTGIQMQQYFKATINRLKPLCYHSLLVSFLTCCILRRINNRIAQLRLNPVMLSCSYSHVSCRLKSLPCSIHFSFE